MSILAGLYGRAAAWRRAWYDADASRRQLLDRPVISVGNLVVGGSGKTPTVAALARLLERGGERPAILSRGYGRRESSDGVVVVSDGRRVLEPVERSGDEPQMLARALDGVPVLVAKDRALAGRLAEGRLGATVHLLDDGFQHLPLARDVDLLIVAPDDLEERLLPSGRLREPIDTGRRADALLVPGSDADAAAIAARLGVGTVFRLTATYDVPRPAPANSTAIAVAGIARPERFFAALRAQGVDVRRELAFRDHHWFSASELASIERQARDAGASIVTTEKDAMRIGSRAGWSYLPMTMAVEPAEAFADWLMARVRAARGRRGAAA